MTCPTAPRRENGRLIRSTKKELTTLRCTRKRAYDAKQQEIEQINPPTSAEAQATETTDQTATPTPETEVTTPASGSEARTNASPARDEDVPTSTPLPIRRAKRTATGRKNLNVQQMVRATRRWGPYEHTSSSNHSSTDLEDTTMEDNSTTC